jgi:hypothetical protein
MNEVIYENNQIIIHASAILRIYSGSFQGCYTQVATMKENESSYEQEGQNSGQADSTAYDNGEL